MTNTTVPEACHRAGREDQEEACTEGCFEHRLPCHPTRLRDKREEHGLKAPSAGAQEAAFNLRAEQEFP